MWTIFLQALGWLRSESQNGLMLFRVSQLKQLLHSLMYFLMMGLMGATLLLLPQHYVVRVEFNKPLNSLDINWYYHYYF